MQFLQDHAPPVASEVRQSYVETMGKIVQVCVFAVLCCSWRVVAAFCLSTCSSLEPASIASMANTMYALCWRQNIVKTYYTSLSKLELPCATKSDVIVVEHGVVRVRVFPLPSPTPLPNAVTTWNACTIACCALSCCHASIFSPCFQPLGRTCLPRWTCSMWAPVTRCCETLMQRLCTSMSHRCVFVVAFAYA